MAALAGCTTAAAAAPEVNGRTDLFQRKRMQGLRLSLQSLPRLQRQQHGRRPILCMVLPSGKPDATLEREQQAHWGARSIKAFSMAELEARKMKYPTTGTEALLMGILTEGTSKASLYLRANGIALFKVRAKTVEVVGKADMFYFSPEHPPLTEAAQKALDWALDEHQKSGSGGEISPTYIVLGVWAQKGSPGQKVLQALGFDDKKAEELLKAEREQPSTD